MNSEERKLFLRERRARRKTGKDTATYPMLISVMQHLTEWGRERPLYKVHWEENTLMLLHNPEGFTEKQLGELKYQQCTPDEDHLVMTFNEDPL